MSVKITGNKDRVVNEVQSRLDKFDKCTKAYENAQKALNESEAKNVELANRPAHEERYQAILSEYKKSAESLKTAARRIEKKTDQEHIHKYFKPRTTFWTGTNNPLSYIHLGFQGYLESVHQQAQQIIKTDFDAQVTQLQNGSQRRKTEALSEIEYSTIDQTFPNIREKLLKENPLEYLRQATLYQYRLLEKKDEAGLFAFGVSWIKNLPKEATWQQVETMSLHIVELAKRNPSIDLTEYRGVVKKWLREHPLPENSTPDPTSPSGRLTQVLGLLYICNNQPLDLSTEAFKIYEHCNVLFPEQGVWKVAKEEAFAAIEYSTIQKNFPNSREKLLKENPSEYLRQATLYQYKLLEKKDEAGLFAFGVSWIKNLPKEATWQQIENMSLLMIELARTNENINLTEYRGALQKWLKKYPLPENSTPDPTSPSGRLTHVLGLLYIYNNPPLDLSDEAFQIYQRCSVLFPEQDVWKAAKEEAFASIEYSSIDQTFPSRREKLLKENPSEYLRQATLYQGKLLEKKDEAGLFAFGVSLIKNLPKEATWPQVENLSFLMVELAKKDPSIDLTEYRNAFQQWLKEHPLPEISGDPTPDPAKSPSGRLTYVLGLLYICNNQPLDLSEKAFQIYQSCGVLFPEQNVWKIAQVRVKVAQALDHINHLRWEKAQELLADLPQDDPFVRNTQIDLNYYRRERISSAVMDIGIPVLLKFLPDSYKESPKVDLVLTILNLGTNATIRKMWVPRLLGMPGRAISFNSFPMRFTVIAPMVGDIIDYVFRHNFSKRLQSAERVASNTLRTVHAAYSLYSDFPLLSPLSAVSMGSWMMSAGQTYVACQEIRLSPTRQALLSTLQLVASDFALGVAVLSYSDLLPAAIQPQQIASTICAKSLIDRVSSVSSSEKGSTKDQWALAAVGIGALAAFRFYRDYPYLWAASVMGDIEYHFSQGRDEEVQRVLTDAENCYFVSSVKSDVREYALYANSLKAYPMCLDNVTSRKEFFLRLDLLLKTLSASHHYKGIRNGVLLKKMDAFIKQHDSGRLKAVFKERPDDKIALFAFQLFLNRAFYLALKHPAAPYSFIHEMKPAFPANYQTITEAFLKLLQDHTESIQEWTQLKMSDAEENPPTKEQIERWNNALPKLQEFFFKHVGEAEVYKILQYFKLLSAFVQSGETQACFDKSSPELHERFFNALVHTIKLLRKDQAYPMADALLKRAQISSFNYNKLMQDYVQFFPLINSPPLQREAASKKLQELETCISSLNPQDECHQQLRPFFESCRVVLSLDTGEYPAAQKLLAQETEDAEVHDEVAAILFERIYAGSQGSEKALSELQIITDNLGPWHHLELFNAYASILSKPQAKLDGLAILIDRIAPIELLSNFTHLLKFELLLSQERFDEAKILFSAPVLPTLHIALRNLLDMFLIERAEQVPSLEAAAHLQRYVTFFDIHHIEKVQSYIHFRALFDSIGGEKDIIALQNVRLSLLAIFETFNAGGRPIPDLLKNKMGNILIKIAHLALEANHRKTGLEALETIAQFVIPNGQTEQLINLLRKQLQN